MSILDISNNDLHQNKIQKTYTYEEAYEETLRYFGGEDLPAGVAVDKYLLRNDNNEFLESNPDQKHRRIAREISRIEKKKYSGSDISPMSEDEVYEYLKNYQRIIPQGSPMYGIGNSYQYISLGNCFVIHSPNDSYGSILKTDEEIVQISKRRGGVGVDISNLRPTGASTRNAARSSTGVPSFMERYSNSIREVGQSGRRGALMLTISVHHPDAVRLHSEEDGPIEDVELPGDQYSAGYKTTTEFYNPDKLDFASIKLNKQLVTGANVSIRLTDEFMNAVINNEKFEQRFPVNSPNPKYSKMVDARAVWRKIYHVAWLCGEPGLMLWDNIIRESPADCYADLGFETVSTNPCGELPLCSADSCRLLLLNLMGYVRKAFTSDAYFDYESFYKDTQVAQRFMDDFIDLEIEKIDQIIEKIHNDPESDYEKNRELDLWQIIREKCEKGRRTGTGITAIADAIAACGVGYASEEGVQMVEKIYATLKLGAYRSSVDMARSLSPFPIWDSSREKNHPYLDRIAETFVEDGDFRIDGAEIYRDMQKYGRRNISLLTTAPTGSVSMLSRSVENYGTSGGIEPQFSIKPYTRLRKGNPGDVGFRKDFTDQNGDHWMEFDVYPAAFKDWMKITGKTDLSLSPWHNNCAQDIDWIQRVRLQSVAQKHVDHSISATINLPSDVKEETVGKIYEETWKSGCKGITVYRDGCRTGVLVNKDENNESSIDNIEDNIIIKTNAPKRPKTIDCDVHHITVKGQKYFVLVGLLNGEPYEVFAGKNGFINKKIKSGQITKVKRGHYKALFDDGSEIDKINSHIESEEAGITRLLSLSLRHGSDIKHCVEQLERTHGDMHDFCRCIARALKKHIKDGSAVTGVSCEICGSNEIVRQEGCLVCRSCGQSQCT
mgnify:CR=1 FL=1